MVTEPRPPQGAFLSPGLKGLPDSNKKELGLAGPQGPMG